MTLLNLLMVALMGFMFVKAYMQGRYDFAALDVILAVVNAVAAYRRVKVNP